MCSKFFNITIDGPAGSGKSTLAKLFAEKFNHFLYINTGSMFRAIAYYLFENNINYADETLVNNVLEKINIELQEDNVYLIVDNNKKDITQYIRSPQISKISSEIAKYSQVREKLLLIQREIASKNNIIMDGRDIGTKVLPNANIKFYLDANIKQRALRRQKQLLEESNVSVNLDELEKEIELRDWNDKNREISPLIKPIDAIVIDTSNKDINETLKEIINVYLSKI